MKPYSSISITRLTEEKALLSYVGEIETNTELRSFNSTQTTRIDEVDINVENPTFVHCRFYQEVRPSIQINTLEISPSVVWMLAGHTQNDVYSNTTWFVK